MVVLGKPSSLECAATEAAFDVKVLHEVTGTLIRATPFQRKAYTFGGRRSSRAAYWLGHRLK